MQCPTSPWAEASHPLPSCQLAFKHASTALMPPNPAPRDRVHKDRLLAAELRHQKENKNKAGRSKYINVSTVAAVSEDRQAVMALQLATGLPVQGFLGEQCTRCKWHAAFWHGHLLDTGDQKESVWWLCDEVEREEE